MKHAIAAALLALPLHALPAHAVVDGQWDPETAGPPMTTWYAAVDPAAQAADTAYVAGMRPHHAGALSMSREYLDDPESSSPVLRDLARAIIRNQSFEIAILDEAAANLARPPVTLDLGLFTLRMQPSATEGLGQWSRFLRSPMPTTLNGLSRPSAPVTRRDVVFAKGMIQHHAAAVEMARHYLADPAARNGFLALMNIDIARDQSDEIRLMKAVIAQYSGDAAAVTVDPASIHGMEHMGHMGHGGMGSMAPAGGAPASPDPAALHQPGAVTHAVSAAPRPARRSAAQPPRPAAAPMQHMH